MPEFKKIASKADIPTNSGKTIQLDGKSLAVFNVGDQFHTIDNTCVHQGGPLGEGTLEGSTVTCPLHRWQYDVKTGACSTNPQVCVKSYPTKVEGDDILVSVG